MQNLLWDGSDPPSLRTTKYQPLPAAGAAKYANRPQQQTWRAARSGKTEPTHTDDFHTQRTDPLRVYFVLCTCDAAHPTTTFAGGVRLATCAINMDLLLSVIGPVFLQKRAVAADGMTVTADGYVPRGSVSGQNVRGAERSSSSDSSGGLGPVLVEVTLRLALFAGCVYTSVRFTQFLGKLKERENQVREQTTGSKSRPGAELLHRHQPLYSNNCCTSWGVCTKGSC